MTSVTRVATEKVALSQTPLFQTRIGETDAKAKAVSKEIYLQAGQTALESFSFKEGTRVELEKKKSTEEETKVALEKQAESKRKQEKLFAIKNKQPAERSNAEYYLMIRLLFYSKTKDLKFTQDDLRESNGHSDSGHKHEKLRDALFDLLKGFKERPGLVCFIGPMRKTLDALHELYQDDTILIDVETIKNYLGPWDYEHYEIIRDCIEVIPEKPLPPFGEYALALLDQTRNAIIHAKKELLSLPESYTKEKLRILKSEFSRKMREHPDFSKDLDLFDIECCADFDTLLKVVKGIRDLHIPKEKAC